MSVSTRSVYALDPTSQKVRFVAQVTPDGWTQVDLESMLGEFIPALANGGIDIALLVSQRTSYLLHRTERSTHYDVDELDTADVVSPLTPGSNAAGLLAAVEQWVRSVASHGNDVASSAKLLARKPEILPLLAGTSVRVRLGAIGVPSGKRGGAAEPVEM